MPEKALKYTLFKIVDQLSKKRISQYQTDDDTRTVINFCTEK